MALQDLIDRVRRAFSGTPEEPEASYYDRHPGAKGALQEELTGVLDDFGEAVHAAARFTGPWIFRKLPDQEKFEVAMVNMVDRAVGQALREHESYLYSRVGWQCVCQCKAHNRGQCSICLNIQGCPEHSAFTADAVDKSMLIDAPFLARSLIEATAVELGFERVNWKGFDDQLRGAITEACRKVVCAAVATSVQEETERLERIRAENNE